MPVWTTEKEDKKKDTATSFFFLLLSFQLERRRRKKVGCIPDRPWLFFFSSCSLDGFAGDGSGGRLGGPFIIPHWSKEGERERGSSMRSKRMGRRLPTEEEEEEEFSDSIAGKHTTTRVYRRARRRVYAASDKENATAAAAAGFVERDLVCLFYPSSFFSLFLSYSSFTGEWWKSGAPHAYFRFCNNTIRDGRPCLPAKTKQNEEKKRGKKTKTKKKGYRHHRNSKMASLIRYHWEREREREN